MITTTNWGLRKPETSESDTAENVGYNMDILDGILTESQRDDLTDGSDASSLHTHASLYSVLAHNHSGVYLPSGNHDNSSHDPNFAEASHSHTEGDLPVGLGTSKVAQIRAWDSYTNSGNSNLFCDGWKLHGSYHQYIGVQPSGSMIHFGGHFRVYNLNASYWAMAVAISYDADAGAGTDWTPIYAAVSGRCGNYESASVNRMVSHGTNTGSTLYLQAWFYTPVADTITLYGYDAGLGAVGSAASCNMWSAVYANS